MSRYAENTHVSSDNSRAEIERTLRRYGATEFAYAWQKNSALVGFKADGRLVRFMLPLPDFNDEEFRFTDTGRSRKQKTQMDAYEQAVRQRWRALALCIKAKLEAVEVGIVTFDQEFLAHMVLPGGKTIGDELVPQIENMIATGKVPALLTMGE